MCARLMLAMLLVTSVGSCAGPRREVMYDTYGFYGMPDPDATFGRQVYRRAPGARPVILVPGWVAIPDPRLISVWGPGVPLPLSRWEWEPKCPSDCVYEIDGDTLSTNALAEFLESQLLAIGGCDVSITDKFTIMLNCNCPCNLDVLVRKKAWTKGEGVLLPVRACEKLNLAATDSPLNVFTIIE